jgi:hypothetical protein
MARSELEALQTCFSTDAAALVQADEEMASLRALVDRVWDEEKSRMERSQAEAEVLMRQVEDLRGELASAAIDAAGEVRFGLSDSCRCFLLCLFISITEILNMSL